MVCHVLAPYHVRIAEALGVGFAAGLGGSRHRLSPQAIPEPLVAFILGRAKLCVLSMGLASPDLSPCVLFELGHPLGNQAPFWVWLRNERRE